MAEIASQLKTLKIKNLSKKHKPNTTWPLEKRIEVVSQYLVLGNMRLVAATTGVSHDLIRQWKIQPWWKELETEIRATQTIELDNKLSKIVERSMEATLDRLENGEHVLNNKTGEIIRKPASLRDVSRVTNDFLSRQQVLRKTQETTSEVSTQSITEQLKALALEFSKWQGKKPKEEDIVDIEAKEIVEENSDALHEENKWEVSQKLPEGEGVGTPARRGEEDQGSRGT